MIESLLHLLFNGIWIMWKIFKNKNLDNLEAAEFNHLIARLAEVIDRIDRILNLIAR